MPEEAPTVRRRPVQRRSAERVQRMLDACAQVLDEVGYDALTTRDVAARAGVPIGSLYQFFAGKQELCRALAERNLEEFLRRLARRFGRRRVSGWPDTAAVVVDEYVAMKRRVPGFGVVDFGDARPGRPYLLDPGRGEENNALVARRLAGFGTGVLALPDRPDLARVLLVAVESTDAVLRLAFRADPDGDPELVTEARLLLSEYLRARLG